LNKSNKVSNTLNDLHNKDAKENLIKKLWVLDRLRGHNFMTWKILDRAVKIWKQEESTNPEILVKYFSPGMTWYITEIDIKNEWLAFWYVFDEFYREWELWYVNLEELSLIKNRLWLPIERDKFFDERAHLNDIIKK
jgi:hypothetical protein